MMLKRWGLMAALAMFACDDGGERRLIDPPDEGVGNVDGGGSDGALTVDEGLVPDASTPDAAEVLPDATVDVLMPDAGTPIAACQNGEDDDGDGLIDYPADPGCAAPDDDDEADPDTAACGDSDDNDDDGLIDFPNDPGCASENDPSEASQCGPDQTFQDVSESRSVVGTTVGRPAVLTACRDNLAPEAAFLFTLRQPVERLHFDSAGSTFDTLLSVRTVCDDDSDEAEIACNDDGPVGRTSAVDIDGPALGDYYIVLDGFLEEQGNFTLNIRAELADGEPCDPAATGPVTCRRGSACAEEVCVPAVCSDGIDNDGDGLIDYPNEPGCDSAEDIDETDPPFPPQCSDGQDNDFNGSTDYPDDRNCDSAADPLENRPPACSDGIDNDGDGLVDLNDPGCTDEGDFSEFNIEACRNGEDDDLDGIIDFPREPGCDSPLDSDETDPEIPRQCSDTIDNDDDGLIDLEDIESCFFAADDQEDNPCDRTDPRLITGLANPRGNTSEGTNDFFASCVFESGNEELLLWQVAEDRPLAGMRINTVGSDIDTALSVRLACDSPRDEELVCDNNSGPIGTSFVEIGPQPAGTDLFILMDGARNDRPGIWRAEITAILASGANCAGGEPWVCGDGLTCRADDAGQTCQVAACANGEDDDMDGVIDFPAEPGCTDSRDDDEQDPDFPEQCANAIDDDEDGLIDFGADPDCDGAGDASEFPACRDLVDNDGDGSRDFDRDGNGFRDSNADPGCACADDPDEGSNPQCSDGCDNDNDGLVDLEDPGCADNPDGPSEFNVAQCRDGIDNDGDGLSDYPNDPGCPSENSPLERNPDPLPECGDGVDNDDDGRIDFAGGDDGCVAAADPSEQGPCDVEQPALDDDGVVEGDTRARQGEHQGSCSFNNAPEVVFVATVPYPAAVLIDTDGSGFDTVLYARSACLPEVEVCAEPTGGDGIDADVDAAIEDAAVEDAAVEDAAVDSGADASFDAGDAGVSDAGLDASDSGIDVAIDASTDAELDAFDADLPDGGAICFDEPTELGCNDDALGVQSEIRFQWEGGDIFVFMDGFGGAGDYVLNFRATYAIGNQCGPELHGYAQCQDGSACLPDDAAGFPTCQVE